jgi:hypothetical protein
LSGNSKSPPPKRKAGISDNSEGKYIRSSKKRTSMASHIFYCLSAAFALTCSSPADNARCENDGTSCPTSTNSKSNHQINLASVILISINANLHQLPHTSRTHTISRYTPISPLKRESMHPWYIARCRVQRRANVQGERSLDGTSIFGCVALPRLARLQLSELVKKRGREVRCRR